ncbi:NADPH-dependent FMN reductase [Lactococcus termiticola]|uniref:NADPH-dependent FMN reductase n=1 Tax=Lactococcus termiticola TaxID=2169526 RepID=A0A2R5HFD6_9LACT|nr:NADPH-dependent FMN reductase [Lactococcus termiticola]GBG96732.1 NADPH-dependent FMN reductase [Lactococcus termiticola]
MKLIGLVGTNNANSTNRKLLQFIQKHFEKDAEIELIEIKDLPMFNKPAEKKLPEVVTEMAVKIDAADGVIIATPEYDHAIPASLMNALAWLSYGIYPFLNKPVMITGASYGTLGSSRAQQQLRQILDAPELKASVMPGSEFLLSHSLQAFDSEGNLNDIELTQKLEALFTDFRLFVKMNEKLSHAQALLQKEAEDFDWETL